MAVRKVPGTTLSNQMTGEIIYTPPVGETLLRNKLSNWAQFLHEDNEIDPFLSVTGVIVGSKMNIKNVKLVHDLCKKYGIKMYKASCSEYEYNIEVKKHELINDVEPVIA